MGRDMDISRSPLHRRRHSPSPSPVWFRRRSRRDRNRSPYCVLIEGIAIANVYYKHEEKRTFPEQESKYFKSTNMNTFTFKDANEWRDLRWWWVGIIRFLVLDVGFLALTSIPSSIAATEIGSNAAWITLW